MYSISTSISIYYFSFSFVSAYFYRITLLPFIYLFVTTVLCIYPLIKFDNDNIKSINAVNSTEFINVLSVFIILITLEPIIENTLLFIKFGGGDGSHISDIYNSNSEGERIEIYSFIGRRLNYISILFSTSSVIFMFYYLTKPKRKTWVLIGLCVVSCNTILTHFNTSNRAGVLSHFFFIICCYLLFKDSLVKSIKRKITFFGLLFFGITILLTAIVTIARFNNSNDASDLNTSAWIALYGGEGPLKFNNDLWYIKYNTNGDDVFPFIKNLVGLDTFTNNATRDKYYLMKNSIQIENFYTVVGDFFYDFGLLGTPVFCFMIFLGLNSLLKKRKSYPLEIIFLIAITAHIFLMGFAAYIHRAYSAQFGLLFPFFVIIVMYLNRKKSLG